MGKKGCLGIFIAVLIVVFIKCCSQAANDYEQAQTREKLEAFQNRPKAQQPAPPAEPVAPAEPAEPSASSEPISPAEKILSGLSQEDMQGLIVLSAAIQQQEMERQREIERNRVCLHCEGRGYIVLFGSKEYCSKCRGLGYGNGGR